MDLPVRSSGLPSPRSLPSLVVALVVLALACALVVSPLTTAPGDASPASPATTPADVAPRQAAGRAYNPDFPVMPENCYTPDRALSPYPCWLTKRIPGAPILVLWGDSHGWQLTPAIRTAVLGKRVNVVTFLQGACPIMDPPIERPGYDAAGCDLFGRSVVDWLRKKKKQGNTMRVIVAMSWELYHNVTDAPDATDERYPGFINDYVKITARKGIQGTPRAFRALAKMRIRTDMVGQQPMVWQGEPPCEAGRFRCPLPRAGVLKDAKENNARIYALRKLLSVKGRLIRPADSLCSSTTCFGEIDGIPTYFDALHVGRRTSITLAPYFTPSINDLLREAKKRRR